MENAYADDASDTVQQIEDDFDLEVEIAGEIQQNISELPGKNTEQFYEDSPHGIRQLNIELENDLDQDQQQKEQPVEMEQQE